MPKASDALLLLSPTLTTDWIPPEVLRATGIRILALRNLAEAAEHLPDASAPVVVASADTLGANWREHVCALRNLHPRGPIPLLIVAPSTLAVDTRDAMLGEPHVDILMPPVTAAALVAKTGRLVSECDGVHGRTADEPGGLTRLFVDERAFQELFEDANEGVWLLDAEDRVVRSNRRIAALLGCPAEELVGRAKRDFVFEDDQLYIGQLHAERQRGYYAAIDVRFRTRENRAVWVHMSSRPLHRAGRYAGSLDLYTDVTTRRLSEERFRVLFELSAAGHALIEPATKRFLHVNERWCQMLGRTRQELLGGLSFVDVTHPDDRGMDQQRFAALYAGSVPEVVAEKRYLRRDGSVFWGQLTSTVVRDREGNPELQMLVIQDISSRKQAEAELIDCRTQLRLAVEAAELGLFFHDGYSDHDVWNERMRRLMGLAADEIEGPGAFFGHVHPEDRTRVEAEFSRLMRVAEIEQEFEIEFRSVWNDGTEHHLVAHGVSQPRTTSGGQATFHLVGTVREIAPQQSVTPFGRAAVTAGSAT